MPRIRFRDLGGSLFVTGPREDTPDGMLRRGRGLHAVRSRSARSRAGSTKLFDLAAHSLCRFVTSRYAGVGTDFYRDGAIIRSGLSGNRLAFVPMPPTAGKPDRLFVAGGGTLFKTDSAGNDSLWGIDPPADGATATPIAQETVAIEHFESAGDWGATPGNESPGSEPAPTVSTEATVKILNNSLEMDVPRSASVAFQKTFGAPINLTVFGSGRPSPLEDYIELWVHLARPARIEKVSVAFFVGETPSGGKVNNLFVKDLKVEDEVSQKQVRKERGLGDLIPVGNQDAVFKSLSHTHPEMLSIQESIGTIRLVATRHTWTRLRLPKSTFHRAGNNTAGWEDIRGMRLQVRTNALGVSGTVARVYFDECALIGSVGMQGDYEYQFTHKNKTTGTRSNPNPTPTTVTGLVRQGAHLANLPVSADPQVDTLEAWRTLGNGAILFKAWEVANGTTTFDDRIADYIGLFGNTTDVLEDELLPLDNVSPRSFGVQDAAGPHYGRMFWARDGTGKIYHSPPDRAEAVGGFELITDTDDTVQKVVRWNDAMWAFTTEGLYQGIGVTEPFLWVRVTGVPGTTRPFTVIPTPAGIFYQAGDGIRLFNGSTASLVAPEALGVLYRGEASENLPAFTGLVADYGNDQYVVSDGAVTLAFHLNEGRWRDLGLACTALFFEDDTELLTASVGPKILIVEDVTALTDDGDPIPFSLQPPSIAPAAGQETLLQRLYVEVNTRGQLIRPTLLLDDAEITLPPLVTPVQAVVEYPVLRTGRVVGVRLDGSVTARVEVVGIEADHYLAGEAPPT